MQGTEKRAKRTKRTEALPPEEALSHPISHPLRVRILEVCNEQEMSATGFVEDGYVPDHIAEGRDPKALVSLISYHCRGLEKAGCIKIVDQRPVRGTHEVFYKGTAVAYFTDAQWAALPIESRVSISRTMYQGMVARFESAMLAETFDARVDRMLAWTPLLLDDQGWTELHDRLESCFADVEQIKVDARKRVEESGKSGTPATFVIAGFESPPPAVALKKAA
jgi:hypothetical protein